MTTNVPFVHLHFHTEYSLLDSACQVDRVMATALDLGMTAVAITDHGVLYGVIDFYKQAKAKGIKAILGCEVYVATGSMRDRKSNGGKGYANHLVLLAENETGYYNLMRMVSLAHLEGFYYKPRIDKELLAQHHKGLIGLSSCLKGEITAACAADNMKAAEKAAGEYAEILGKGQFFLELQDHGLPEQRAANRNLIQLSRRTGLPLVATNDVHYLKPEHAEAHEVLLCLQTQTTMSDPDRMRYRSDQFYMKSGAEMMALFAEVPEAVVRTVEIADRCNVALRLGEGLHFPLYQVPDGVDPRTFLESQTWQGIQRRYGIADPKSPKDAREKGIVERTKYELKVIEQTGFVNYFLVVWDFIRFARERNIPVGPGRGSGAGSIVAYALGITGLDPLRYKLIFERFLNPERVSPPDFDVDFCQDRREEVIQYVREKYGKDNVAQIITFGALGAKTVIRDIGRALEIPLKEYDALAKLVPEDPKITLEKALQESADFRKACAESPHAQRILKYARVLEGLPRNPGRHAAGVVIGEKPLIELVPLSRDKDGEIITQFEMKPLEATGLLKMDFLGLKTLTVIRGAVDNVRRARGIEVNIDQLPLDDAETYELLNRGDTIGVFQVESKGMQDLLRRVHVDCIEDLIATIALFRPGPMNMLEDYINRKHGRVAVQYPHPLLEPILKETYGIMLYQEQVQQVANVLAGFSLGQGDILRRAMGKKDPKEMARMRDQFIQGCQKHRRIPKEKAEAIFDTIERFAGYGFNKSHSAAYAILCYETAYLKAHHPVEFMAALLTSEIGNFDKLPELVAEAQEMGIEIRPPNVNDSDVAFKPEGDAIRYGLAGVKTIGVGAVEAIIRERRQNGPFKGLVDFCCRVDLQVVNRKMLEGLIKCGAFDFTGISRGRLFKGLDNVMAYAQRYQRDRASGQGSLFEAALGGSDSTPADDAVLPQADPWPESVMLSEERALLGFYISGHPLVVFQWVLKTFALADIGTLLSQPPGAMTRVGGLVTRFEKRYTKKRENREPEPFGTFRLEDVTGAIDVVAFPEAYRNYGLFLQENAPVMVCGELTQDRELRITAREIHPLKDVPAKFTTHLSLHVSVGNADEAHLGKIREILAAHPGETAVTLCLVFPSGEKVFIRTDREYKVLISEELVKKLMHLLGEDAVYLDVWKYACRSGNGNGRRTRT
jgi:DNA polymerase-3 subunit alpha